MKTEQVPKIEELQECGFAAAAKEMELQKGIATPELREKLRLAFEFYRVVEPRHIDEFNMSLRKKTRSRVREGGQFRLTWQELEFTRIENYRHVPPPEVLVELRKAKGLKWFDYFEVATIGIRTEYRTIPTRIKDPILFGRIKESENRYFIAQWDDDVKIEDILKEDEG